MDYLFLAQTRTKIKSKNRLAVIFFSIYFLSLPLGATSLFQYGSVLKYVAIIPVFVFLVGHDLRFRISKISSWQLLYTLLPCISIFYSINTASTLQRIKTNMMFCVLLICMGSVIFNEVEIKKMKNALIWSSRITCIFMIIFGSIASSGRLSLRGLITEDPNYINGYLLFGVVNAMQMILKKSDYKQKLFAATELLLYTYSGLATGSRGGLFCIIGSTLTIFIFERIKGDQVRKMTKKIGLLILIIVIISMVVDYIPRNVAERFQLSAIIESRGTNRYEYWEWAINILKNESVVRQVFGFGAGTIRDIFGMYGYGSMVTHNIFIEQFMEGGIILLVVYCCLIITCLLKAKERQDLFTFAVLIGFIILSLSTSLYAFKPYWNAIIFCNLLYVRNANEK